METQTRRKVSGGVRSWVVVTEQGQSQVEEVGKHSLMRRTGLPPRDLRLLDPLLSYPSSILGRDRAIVVNLEHIRAIITPKEVLMVNTTNPLLSQFHRDLCHRVSRSAEPSPPQKQEPDIYDSSKDESVKVMIIDMIGVEGHRVMPFEFRALEACLESACRSLETETFTLEEEAYPALDELTSKISTLNLERVRQIKSRLVTLSGRVQKVRDEVEHLLDDDNDMAEMYLTEKLISLSMDQIPPREGLETEGAEGSLLPDVADNERYEESESDQQAATGLKPDVQELEMLLEAYFAQIDGILQKLSDMNEYVDDTEDCINIMLDDKQNKLLRMGVMLATANMILNAGIVVVGLFGMNIAIPLYDGDPGLKFWETTAGTIVGSVIFFLIILGWGRKRNILAF